MEDIAPGLLEKIQGSFNEAVESSQVIASVYQKIRDGTATYKEANDYAVEVGQILAAAFRTNISAEQLPDNRMYYNIADRVVTPTMTNNYNIISQVTTSIQKILNEKANIGIKAIAPDNDVGNIKSIVDKVSAAEDYDDVAWVLDEPVVTYSQQVVDNAIKTNSQFHANAGLSAKIIRTSSGGCCKWCSQLAGTYSYPNVPKEVFSRHNHCRCTVDYNPGSGSKVQDVWSKHWRTVETREPVVEQNYLPIKKGKQDSFVLKKSHNLIDIKAYKIEGYDNMYIEENTKVKPRELHNINENVNAAIKDYKLDPENKPAVIIVDKYILKAYGQYDSDLHTMFLIPEIGSKQKLAELSQDGDKIVFGYTEYHESWHWKQATRYGKEIDEEYMKYLMEESKKNIDKLGINEYNVSEISEYAKKSYVKQRYDEVEAEYYAKLYTGG